MDEFDELEAFIRSVPGIGSSMHGRKMGKGRFENGNWWVKFSIDIEHSLAWNVVQEFSNVLNYLSVTERLPTVFKPVSPPSYLNGGPKEFLSWVIESTNADFAPKSCVEWLAGRLPQPVADPAMWRLSNDRTVLPSKSKNPSESAFGKRDLPKLADCEEAGQIHKWFNLDDVSSACYNCRVVRPGQLWRRGGSAPPPK